MNSRWHSVILLLIYWCHMSYVLACSLSQFQCSTPVTCIPRSYVCDHEDDCDDGSDEQNCPFDPVDMSTALISSVNSNGGSSFLVKMFGNPDDYVWKFRNGNQSTWPIHRNSMGILAQDYYRAVTTNYQTDQVYYGNNLVGFIEYGLYVYQSDLSEYYYPAVPISKQVNGIAYDWVARNVYWTDGEYKLIGMVPELANRWTWKIIISTNLTSPQDVVVDPLHGYLFWSDGNSTSAKIERSDLSGHNRMVLLNSTQGLVAPTTLVVDFTSQRLYWLDVAASILGSVNFDGSNVTKWSKSVITNFSAMAVHSKYIYFGSKDLPKVYIYNKTDVTYISNTTIAYAGVITDMVMFSSESQPSSSNPCATNKGQCTSICLATSATTRICDCPYGYLLASNGADCNIRPFLTTDTFLFVAEFNHQNIYQMLPETGEIRALMTAVCSPSSVAVDTKQGVVYSTCRQWTANSYYVYIIRRRSFDGKTDDIIYTASRARTQMLSLALDAGRSLLYYTDNILGVIAEIRTDGTQRREIISNESENPHAIVVDISSRRLYWTDCAGPPTIQTMSVDGTDRRTLVTGDAGSCFTDLAIDFDRQTMYWTVVNNPAIEKATLNGTERVKIFSEPRAYYTGITLMDDIIFIADKNRRNIQKLNVSSDSLVSQGLAIFSNISDVKFFNFSAVPSLTPSTSMTTLPPTAKTSTTVLLPATSTTTQALATMTTPTPSRTSTTIFVCVFRITNLEYTPSLGDPDSSEYKNLSAVIIPLLSKVFRDEFGSIFLSIVNVYFTSGSVVVSNEVGLSSPPTDDMVNRTTKQVGDQLAANGFNVTVIRITGSSKTTTVTSTQGSSSTTAQLSSSSSPDKLALIVGVVIGVGGFIITVVVVIVCVMVCLLAKKNKRNNSERRSGDVIIPDPAPPRCSSVYDEIKYSDMAMADVGCANGGYEPLHTGSGAVRESCSVYQQDAAETRARSENDYIDPRGTFRRATANEDAEDYLHFEQHGDQHDHGPKNTSSGLVTVFNRNSMQPE